MAFNVVAQLQLQGPTNLSPVINTIQNSLRNIKATVNVDVSPGAAAAINNLNTQLRSLQATLGTMGSVATAAGSAVRSTSASYTSAATSVSALGAAASKTIQELKSNAAALNEGANAAESFGRAAGLAARRYAAFLVAGGAIIQIVNGFKSATAASFEFERELVRLTQIGAGTQAEIKGIEQEVTRLATTLGVSSKELIQASVVLGQAGFTANQTKQALEALAQAALSPNFGNMNQTIEGAIAVMQQFRIDTNGLSGALGSMNAVASAFAVESKDLIEAVKRAGGAFRSTGGDLNEFLALFTSVRATTRESAEAIATGLRTIFTRLQRQDTVEALQSLGVQLRYTRTEALALGNVNLENQFVGAFEAVNRLNQALKEVPGSDPRFSQIIEQLGGYRQISRVLPLIQELTTAQKAYNVAQFGQFSLQTSAGQAQEATIVKLEKLKQQFLALFRTVTESQGFKIFLDLTLRLADALTKLADVLTPLIPVLGTMMLLRGGIGGVGFLSGLAQGLGGHAGRPLQRAGGGVVPGVGDTDTVPAVLTPGEYVIRKSAVQAIGVDNLEQMNQYARGGPVRRRRYADGGNVISRERLDEIRAAVINDHPDADNIIRKHTGINPTTPSGVAQLRELKKGILQEKQARNLSRGVQGKDLNMPFTGDNLGLLTLGFAEQSGLRVVHGMSGVREANRTANQAIDKAGIQDARTAVTFHVLSKGAADRFKKEYESKIDTALNSLFPKNSGIKINLSGAKDGRDALNTISGYMFEGFIGNAAGQAVSGGTNTFEYPGNLTSAPRFANLARHIYPPILPGELVDLKRTTQVSKKGTDLVRKYVNWTSDNGRLFKELGIARPPTRKAAGGGIDGEGSVPALLTPGEYVFSKDSASRIGLNNLNRMNNYAFGGVVMNLGGPGQFGGLFLDKPSKGGASATGKAGYPLSKVSSANADDLLRNTKPSNRESIRNALGMSRNVNTSIHLQPGGKGGWLLRDTLLGTAYNTTVPVQLEGTPDIHLLAPKTSGDFKAAVNPKVSDAAEAGTNQLLSGTGLPYNQAAKRARSAVLQIGERGVLGYMFESALLGLNSNAAAIANRGNKDRFDIISPNNAKLATLFNPGPTSGFLDVKAGLSGANKSSLVGKAASLAAKGTIPVQVDMNSSDLTAIRTAFQAEKVAARTKRKIPINANMGGLIPSLLTPGEYVMGAGAVSRFGTNLFNNINAKRFATGGPVGITQTHNVPAGDIYNYFEQSKLSAAALVGLVRQVEEAMKALPPALREGAKAIIETSHGVGEPSAKFKGIQGVAAAGAKRPGDTGGRSAGTPIDLDASSGYPLLPAEAVVKPIIPIPKSEPAKPVKPEPIDLAEFEKPFFPTIKLPKDLPPISALDGPTVDAIRRKLPTKGFHEGEAEYTPEEYRTSYRTPTRGYPVEGAKKTGTTYPFATSEVEAEARRGATYAMTGKTYPFEGEAVAKIGTYPLAGPREFVGPPLPAGVNVHDVIRERQEKAIAEATKKNKGVLSEGTADEIRNRTTAQVTKELIESEKKRIAAEQGYTSVLGRLIGSTERKRLAEENALKTIALNSQVVVKDTGALGLHITAVNTAKTRIDAEGIAASADASATAKLAASKLIAAGAGGGGTPIVPGAGVGEAPKGSFFSRFGTPLLLGANLLATYGANVAEQIGGKVSEARTPEQERSATRTAGISSGLTSATLGASLLGSLIPFGAAIGAITGGLYGFISGVSDADKELKNIKIDKTLNNVREKLDQFANGIPITAASAQNVIKDLSEGRSLITQRSIEDSKNFFGRVNFKSASAAIDTQEKERLGNLAPQMAQLLSKSAEDIGKAFGATQVGLGAPNFDGKALLDQFRNANFGLNKELISNLASVEKTSPEEIEKRFVKTLSSASRQEFLRSEDKRLVPENEKIFQAFGRLGDAAQKAADGLNGLQRRATLLEGLLEGRVGGSFTGLSKVAGTTAIIEPFGDTGKLLGETSDELGRVTRELPGILNQVFQGDRLGGKDFGTVTKELLASRLTGGDPTKVTGPLRNIIDTVGLRLAQLEPDEARKLGGADVTRLSGKLLEDFKPISDEFERLGAKLEKNGNDFVEGLAKYAAMTQKLSQEQDKLASIQLEKQKNLATSQAEAQGRPGDVFRLLTLEQSQRPLLARQERLTKLTGDAASNPELINEALQNVYKELRKAEKEAAAEFSKPGAATKLFIDLQQQSANLTQALKNLTEVSERNAAIQDRLNKINEDRQSRISFGQKALTADPAALAQMNRDILLVAKANQQQNLAGFTPSQIKRTFDLLDSAGNARFTGLQGQPVASDLKNILSVNELKRRGIDVEPQKAEADVLKAERDKNIERAEAAQKLIIENQKTIQGEFFDNLSRQQDLFFARLSVELQEDRRARLLIEAGSAGEKVSDIKGKLDITTFLESIGITNIPAVARGGAARKDLESFGEAVSSRNTNRRTLEGELAKARKVDISGVLAGITESPLFGPDFSLSKKSLFSVRDEGFSSQLLPKMFETFRAAGLTEPGEADRAAENFRTRAQEFVELRGKTRGVDSLRGETVGSISGDLNTIARSVVTSELTNRFRGINQPVEALRGQIAGRGTFTPEQLGKIETTLATKSIADLTSEIDKLKADDSLPALKKTFDELNGAAGATAKAIAAIDTAIAAGRTKLAGIEGKVEPSIARFFGAKADGGPIVPNTPSSSFPAKGTDTVLAMLTPGEFVVRREQAQANIGLLHAINGGRGNLAMAEGGLVYLAGGGAINKAEFQKMIQEHEKDKKLLAGRGGVQLFVGGRPQAAAQVAAQPQQQREETSAQLVARYNKIYATAKRNANKASAEEKYNVSLLEKGVADAEEKSRIESRQFLLNNYVADFGLIIKPQDVARLNVNPGAFGDNRKKVNEAITQAQFFVKPIPDDFTRRRVIQEKVNERKKIVAQEKVVKQTEIDNRKKAFKDNQQAKISEQKEAAAARLISDKQFAESQLSSKTEEFKAKIAARFNEANIDNFNWEAQLGQNDRELLNGLRRTAKAKEIQVGKLQGVDLDKATNRAKSIYAQEQIFITQRAISELKKGRLEQNESIEDRAAKIVEMREEAGKQITSREIAGGVRPPIVKPISSEEKVLLRNKEIARERAELQKKAGLRPDAIDEGVGSYSREVVLRKENDAKVLKISKGAPEEVQDAYTKWKAAILDLDLVKQNLPSRQADYTDDQKKLLNDNILSERQLFNKVLQLIEQVGKPDPPYQLASGGIVPGIGNRDTVRALLTPGEFVMNKSAVERLGANNLNDLQRFANGGPVGSAGSVGAGVSPDVLNAFRGFTTSASSLAPALTGFAAPASTLVTALTGFGDTVNNLVNSLGRIPTSITMEGRHEMVVVVNGLEVLGALEPNLQAFVVSKINEELDRYTEEKFPDVGRRI